MTARTPDKTAARSLAHLTGAPYQSCLTAVAVLRTLPAGFDLGSLAGVLTGRAAPRPLPLTLPPGELRHLERAWGPPGTCWARGSVIVTDDDNSGVRLLIPLVPDNMALPDNVTLYADTLLTGPRVRPGLWQIDAVTLRRAVATTDRRSNDDCTLELAGTAAALDSFPDIGAHDAYLSDKLRTAIPHRTSAGPGFSWVHLPFTDLGLVRDDDHRDVDCDDPQCGYLHHWPTADADRTELVLPDALLAAWRALAVHDPEPISNESWSYRIEGGAGQPHWYGLDLPDWSTLWLRVMA